MITLIASLPLAVADAASATTNTDVPDVLITTNSNARHISFITPAHGVTAKIEVGALPWGMTLSGNRAYVATAEGVAVVDLARGVRTTLVPYLSAVGVPGTRFSDDRPGGEGIAASPDGRFVYVGVLSVDGVSRLEILDTARLRMTGSVPVGQRPFQVLVAHDGSAVYTLDHDSFSVSVVDPLKRTARRFEVAPIGRSAFDKPHYAALLPDGRLLMPFAGKHLVFLDPRSGSSITRPLSADTHQHGIALTPDGRQALIVGTGAYGTARNGPSLTIYDLRSGKEYILPLARAHEQVAVSRNGRHAYLSGGFTFHDGWSGITVVDLEKLAVAGEIAVPDLPLDIWLARRARYNRSFTSAAELSMPSFDIVSEVNQVEVHNAVDQCNKEVSNRFDFKGSDARVEINEKDKTLTVFADDDFKLGQVRDVLTGKLAKRGIDIRCLKLGDAEKISGNKVKQLVTIRAGVEQELGKKIIKLIKDSKMKVQGSIQGDTVRVSGAKKDLLQDAIALVRKSITDFPLQFKNFRD